MIDPKDENLILFKLSLNLSSTMIVFEGSKLPRAAISSSAFFTILTSSINHAFPRAPAFIWARPSWVIKYFVFIKI